MDLFVPELMVFSQAMQNLFKLVLHHARLGLMVLQSVLFQFKTAKLVQLVNIVIKQGMSLQVVTVIKALSVWKEMIDQDRTSLSSIILIQESVQ